MKNCGFQFHNTYIRLPEVFYTRTEPTPVRAPQLIVLNETLATMLGLDFSGLSTDEQAAIFSGNRVLDGAEPVAQAYAGHQYGYFTMLGDGRVHLIGEHNTSDGRRIDIQLKGSGKTPYSRRGDGRAALGPMLREYLISEAMFGLGIPTTRSLAVVLTGEDVRREALLPGAILTRVASSYIRIGTFEYAAAKMSKPLIQILLDETIDRLYPALNDAENKALALLQTVMERQADLIVNWMRVGFIHGVMNTDNMALSGETIDYGPCAFLDSYDPSAVFSSIDHHGRYAYANQPFIAQWNIARLADALLPLIDKDMHKAVDTAETAVKSFYELYENKWLAMMRAKLGLFGALNDDKVLISDLLAWMHKNRIDYTNFFRDLSQADRPTAAHYGSHDFNSWYTCWQMRLTQNDEPIQASLRLMKKSNPIIIPRNHHVEHALQAASNGDLSLFNELLSALNKPYQESELSHKYSTPPLSSERVHQTFCGT